MEDRVVQGARGLGVVTTAMVAVVGGSAVRRRQNVAVGGSYVRPGSRGGGPGQWRHVKLGLFRGGMAWCGARSRRINAGDLVVFYYGFVRIRNGDEHTDPFRRLSQSGEVGWEPFFTLREWPVCQGSCGSIVVVDGHRI
uniref:Predicted protein n=1 Tax=Hordeum vulgare subsp. vulgare TaxID=112509 RepID=F2E8R2_HORVV|nr:predicted protein [Hordeum vulgare subsp. vulgare]